MRNIKRCVCLLSIFIGLITISYGDEQKAKEPPQVWLKLVDGSHLKGTTSISLIKLNTPFGEIDIPFELISRIEFIESNKETSVYFHNGDKLTGTLDLQAVKLTAVFGDVSVRTHLIKKLHNQSFSGKLIIRAFIDDSDTIKIQGNDLWYEHHSGDMPGKWEDSNEPTYINKKKWYPQWSGSVSSKYRQLSPTLPKAINKKIKLTKVAGRGSATVAEEPMPENDFTLSITFQDRQFGADWYDIMIEW